LTEHNTAGQALRLLVVSEREEARDEVGQALDAWRREHRLYWVSQPELAPARAEELVPHIILVDDGLTGANVVALIRDLAAVVPGSAILALVEADALDRARQAVLAGARGFLTKPLQADEFLTTLQQTLAPRPAAAREPEAAGKPAGCSVVFCAPKGGTGRTTLAINTSIGLLQATKQRVVLLDADYSAPALDVALNVHSERDITDLLPRLSRLDEELISGVLAHHASGLDVLLAPAPANLASPISLPQVQYLTVVLKRIFPWVMVDLGLPLDEMAFAFLDTADRIVMSVLPELVGLRNTRLMLDQLRGRGYNEDKIWLVVNRATMKGGVSVGDIEERLKMKVAHRIPDDQPLATYTINRGVPLMLSHRNSAVARAVRGLAQMLVGACPAPVPEQEAESEKRRGLFGTRRAAGA
jgi:pilus assembly protein CpaE